MDLVARILGASADCVLDALNSGENPNVEHDGFSALYWACMTSDVKKVQFLVEHGADVNRSATPDGGTVLLNVAFTGDERVLDYLLSVGANPELSDFEGCNSFMAASKSGHDRILKKFVACGFNPHTKDAADRTPLHWACTDRDYPCVVKYLLELGLNVFDKSKQGMSPLEYARSLGLRESLKLLEQAAGRPTEQ